MERSALHQCVNQVPNRACSELRIPEGGALWLHVPGVVVNGSCAGEDCVVLTAASAPAIGKYQSPAISGARRRLLRRLYYARHALAPQHIVRQCAWSTR